MENDARQSRQTKLFALRLRRRGRQPRGRIRGNDRRANTRRLGAETQPFQATGFSVTRSEVGACCPRSFFLDFFKVLRVFPLALEDEELGFFATVLCAAATGVAMPAQTPRPAAANSDRPKRIALRRTIERCPLRTLYQSPRRSVTSTYRQPARRLAGTRSKCARCHRGGES
jgi:hypothetical protein